MESADAVAFDAYPRAVTDSVLSAFAIAPGELVVDAGCQLFVGLGAAGALVLALDPFGLPAKAVASFVDNNGDAPIHFARGHITALPAILARELGPAMQPRVVSFGSAFRFLDRAAALDACDRCGAEGVALVFGTAAPSPWRATVADVIKKVGRSRRAQPRGAKNESLVAAFAGSAFSHVATTQLEIRLERTAKEVAALATFFAMRAGIVAEVHAGFLREDIVTRLKARSVASVYVEDVTYTVVAARRAHDNRVATHPTARSL